MSLKLKKIIFMKSLVLLVFIFIMQNAFSQKADTIWFLNGERLITNKYSINEEEGILTYYNKRDKKKMVGLEYVFSVIDSNNNEHIYFEPTTIGKRFYSVEDMRNFIKGEYMASQNYKSPFPFISGFITGAGSVYAVPYLTGLNIFFSPLVPSANTAIIGTFNYKDDKIKRSYPDYADNNYFIAGYKEVVVQKRIINSIKGGLIGLGTGIVVAILIHNYVK